MRKKIVVIFFIICIFSVAAVSFELSASRTTSKANSAEETRFNPTRRVNKEAVLEGNLTAPLQSVTKNASETIYYFYFWYPEKGQEVFPVNVTFPFPLQEYIVKTPEAWEKQIPMNVNVTFPAPFTFNLTGQP